ncbi:MFS transporter [Actinomadura fulvescens]|uniref:DHA2 family efflux MFS transporter permease subunit n=1 Tax=Actinomadura fulvescens TaxID=46160 RepID=A0ABP6C5C3_9ACTN
MPPDARGGHRGLALALLVTVQFVLILDASIVNVALPAIGRDLHFDQADLSWVANAYTLTFGGFLLFGGRIADLAGRRRMFVTGLALFTAASLAGGLAPTSAALVAARAVQGLGAALVAPAALSLIMTLFEPGPERNRALGLFGAVAGAGGAAGTILGGLLTDWFGWASVLYVNVPIGVVAIGLAPLLLPEARDHAVRGFDLIGAASITGGLALLVYTLVDANDAGWSSAQTYGLGGVALALIAVFFVAEARVAHPLVPLRIFRRRDLRGANLVAVAMTMAIFPMFFVMTLYLQQVLGYGPVKAGLGQLPVALAMGVGAGVGSQLVTRFGFRVPLAGGLLVVAAGLVWFAQMPAPGGDYLVDVFGPALVMGVGGGVTFVATTIAATAGASPAESGLASGLINTTQQVGGALGLAVAVAVSTAVTKDAFTSGERVPSVALNEGFQAGMLTSAGLAVLGAVLALVLIPRRSREPITPEPERVLAP